MSLSVSPDRTTSPSSSSTPSPASRYSELSDPNSVSHTSATSTHSSPLKETQHLPIDKVSHHVLMPSLPKHVTSLPALVRLLRELPIQTYDNTADATRKYVVLGLEVVTGEPREEEPPVETPLGEAGVVGVVEKVMGDEGILGKTKWSNEEGFFQSIEGQVLDKKVESVDIETFFKDAQVGALRLSHATALNVFSLSCMHVTFCFPSPYHSNHTTLDTESNSRKHIYVLTRAPFAFPPQFLSPLTSLLEDDSSSPHPYNLPSVASWRRLWAFWDLITMRMIPLEMLHHKPIDLRHKCLFYIGHIPTFLDMLAVRELEGESETDGEGKGYTNKWFVSIFERGIDPHVDDPEYCHSHSEVPVNDEDWPVIEDVTEYRDRVRARLLRIYDEVETGKRRLTRRLVRVMQMAYEHEGFHVETLLYMLIQRSPSSTINPQTIPPYSFPTPPHELLALQHAANPLPSTPFIELGPATFTTGIIDPEPADLLIEGDGKKVQIEMTKDETKTHVVGWDNESPKRVYTVGKFKAEWRTITNGEFYEFWKASNKKGAKLPIPGSWIEIDEKVHVLTLTGSPLPISLVWHTPLLASYDLIEAYAQSKGGRLPTEPELRLLLDTYAVNYDEGAATGGRAWVPIVATMGLAERNGCGTNGNVWEWTSTLFDTHEGFIGTTIFPGYSSDFFDGVHHVVLGASYATIPRIADRNSLRNFWQHNYPYAWVGGRVVYDA